MIQHIEAKLNELLELPDGWDGRSAHAVTASAADVTVRLLAALTDESTAPPQLFPLPDGGLQIEWHVGGNSVEVEVDAQGEPHMLASTSDGTVIVEGVMTLGKPDPRLLTARRFLQRLFSRPPGAFRGLRF